MTIEGTLVGSEEELAQFLKDNRHSFKPLGGSNVYLKDNTFTRLFFGTPEKRARKYAAERARSSGENEGAVMAIYSCSCGMNGMRLSDEWTVSVNFYGLRNAERASA
jgi:hypothetical protein